MSAMTLTLRTAFARAEALPDSDQDALAALVIAEIESEARWDELFARPESETLLAKMAADAMREHDAGRTRPLDKLLSDG